MWLVGSLGVKEGEEVRQGEEEGRGREGWRRLGLFWDGLAREVWMGVDFEWGGEW